MPTLREMTCKAPTQYRVRLAQYLTLGSAVLLFCEHSVLPVDGRASIFAAPLFRFNKNKTAMISFRLINVFLGLLVVSLFTSSCDDEQSDTRYTVPETYAFDNVDYDGQLQRLSQLQEMKSYLVTAELEGATLDADQLKAMFANDAANAGWSRTYSDSKQLKNKTLENQQAWFENLMDKVAEASESAGNTAQEGAAGVAVSNDGAKRYLLDANGVELTQLIEKGLMGACFYYQATAVYFGDGKMNVDNTDVTPGEGTDMEHHWDEAFGYFGVPTDFPVSTDGVVFWGKYSNGRDGLLGTNETMMEGFIKGRAAISNGDLETRDEAIEEVRDAWEIVSAATAVHYINSALDNPDDVARRHHALSEAIAFIYSLQFNPAKTVTNAQVEQLIADLAGSSTVAEMNLYQTTDDDLKAVRDALSATFGFETVMADL